MTLAKPIICASLFSKNKRISGYTTNVICQIIYNEVTLNHNWNTHNSMQVFWEIYRKIFHMHPFLSSCMTTYCINDFSWLPKNVAAIHASATLQPCQKWLSKRAKIIKVASFRLQIVYIKCIGYFMHCRIFHLFIYKHIHGGILLPFNLYKIKCNWCNIYMVWIFNLDEMFLHQSN